MASDQSIKISKKTKDLLDKEKKYDRETYDYVINRLLNTLLKMKGGKK